MVSKVSNSVYPGRKIIAKEQTSEAKMLFILDGKEQNSLRREYFYDF